MFALYLILLAGGILQLGSVLFDQSVLSAPLPSTLAMTALIANLLSILQLPMDLAADYHNPGGENVNLLSIFDVGTLLGLANVTTEEQNAARFNSKAKTLFSMVTNFYAFRNVLRKLGFTDQIASHAESECIRR
jgi:hypothetical protein